MKKNHNDYSSFLAFIGVMLLIMNMHQCSQADALSSQADALSRIEDELEIISIKQK